MAYNSALKLPEFWETAAAAWFAQAEAQFTIRGIADDDETCYYHVVAALSSSTAARVVHLITSPPTEWKYAFLKAHLLKTFELSYLERANRLLDMPGLGDRKPSEHMEVMLNLLGSEQPNFLFRALFLRHMPPQVRTALANSTTTDPRALAAEADLFFLAAQCPTTERLAPVRAHTPPRSTPATGKKPRKDRWCYKHARYGAKAIGCQPPCSYSAAGNENAYAQ